jgi:predicted amidohydrolase
MRIATLQFSPILGAVEQNIAKANELIEEAGLGSDGRELDLLVGPELGFCGGWVPSIWN